MLAIPVKLDSKIISIPQCIPEASLYRPANTNIKGMSYYNRPTCFSCFRSAVRRAIVYDQNICPYILEIVENERDTLFFIVCGHDQ